MRRATTVVTYALTSLVGVIAFLYPFWLPQVARDASGDLAHAGDSALMVTVLVGICFAVLLLEVQREAVGAKSIALLGVLVAINATLRFVEVAVPGPGGFSPIFPLIIFGGYIFGGGFGFLLGALTLLVSGLVTGAVGPWLPYQMFTAGWIGLSAPLCRPIVHALRGSRTPHASRTSVEVWVLALFAGYWGLLFGAIMNLWFWPFAVGPAQMHWVPGAGVWETVQRYLVFYVVTSLAWDLARAVGNFVLVAFAGAALLRVLRRFHVRFAFAYAPAPLAPGPIQVAEAEWRTS
ncbi:MAG: ECF transporter S component [Caldilineaceae bacterium]|jgi:energy-coupling factor transport system substrate-specific component|nr:ECF transporter S component [Caldilineaceae bacterium]